MPCGIELAELYWLVQAGHISPLLRRGWHTKDQPHGRILVGSSPVLASIIEIEVHLSNVAGRQLVELLRRSRTSARRPR